MQMNDFLSKLKNVRKSGNGYIALCPAHSDVNPSLSITELGDHIVINCFAGCEFSAILKALDLQPDDLLLRENGQCHDITESNKRRIVAKYDYQNESGELLFQVVRYEPKKFSQRRPDGHGGWIWDRKGVSPVLYRLPELVTTPLEQLVFFVEGEKSVDHLIRLGQSSTCSPGGAGNWQDEFAFYFTGRWVAILPDNDEAGHAHAHQVATSLYGIAETIKIIHLPGLQEKEDVHDWLEQK